MQREASEVSNILWRQRQLLELLVFKLEEEHLVLASGRTRWLSHATREVETVLEEIKRLELDRAIHVDALARVLDLPPAPSLRELGEAAPDPWAGIFAEHRRSLLELAQDVEGLAHASRDMLSRGQQAIRDALMHAGEVTVSGYTPTGSLPHEGVAQLRVV